MTDLSALEIKNLFPSVMELGKELESQSLDFEISGTYSEPDDTYNINLSVHGGDKELLLNIYNTLMQVGDKAVTHGVIFKADLYDPSSSVG